MSQLNSNMLVLAMSELHNLPQRLNLAVFPKSAVLRRDSAFRSHGCRFYNRQSGTALDDATQVGEVPCCLVPVFC